MGNLKGNNKQINLRPYQEDYILKLDILDKKDKFSTIVSLPTGGGKTVIGIKFCLDRVKEGHKILWLADRVNLLEQSIKKFNQYELGSDISYQLICRNVNSVFEISRVAEINSDTQILFASVGSITAVADGKSNEFDKWIEASQEDNKKLYIIYDEAHHIGANEIQKFFSCLFTDGKDIKYSVDRFGMVGLTATVFRNDRYLDVFNAWFKDGFIGDKQVCITSPYGEEKESEKNNRIEVITLSELVKKGYLVKPDIYKVDEFQDGMPEDEMEYLADRIRKHSGDWGKTIVFVKSKRQAMQLGMLLCDNKIPCFVYISNNNLEQDDKIYKDYCLEKYADIRNEGSVGKRAEDEFHNTDCRRKIMITVDMVSEGYDIQDLNTIYLYSKIGSHIKLRQRVGRVLRSPKDSKKEAKVFWQKYSNTENILKAKDIPDTLVTLKPQEETELDKDVSDYNDSLKKDKSAQIPAAMYREELPYDLCQRNNYYSYYEFLQILKMFSTVDIQDGLGYFYEGNEDSNNDQDNIIWVRRPEKNGYLQLHNMIYNDYSYHLRFEDDRITDFDGYSNALGVSKDELLEDIKKICFYLSNKSHQDIDIRKSKRTIQVKDEEITRFCDWVLQDNDLRLPAFKDKSVNAATEETDSTEVRSADGIIQQESMSFLAEYIKENFVKQEPPKTIEEAMKIVADMKSNRIREERLRNKEKEYTDLLVYGEAEYIYQELMSARSLIQAGIVSQPRIQGQLRKKDVDLAFLGLDTDIQEVKHLNRKCENEIAGNDLLIISNAIINTINHIQITEEDVNEYKKNLLGKLSKLSEIFGKDDISVFIPKKNIGKKQLVMEFLMALGYAYNFSPHKDITVNTDNDKLIRMQCHIFGDDLPDILKFVIYDRIYINLYQDVNYYDSNNQLRPVCQNVDVLNDKYEMILDKYCVDKALFESSGLNPVADVIYDYRPYFKAVQYYQGIKPEFLCRLVNDVFQLDKVKTKMVIDSFGGSGVCSMNSFYKDGSKPKRVYNDFSDMNVSFYKCLQDNEKKKQVADLVEETFNKAFSYARGREENEEDKLFFKNIYENYLSSLQKSNLYSEMSQDSKNAVDKAMKFLEYGIDELENRYLSTDKDKQNLARKTDIYNKVMDKAEMFKKVLEATQYNSDSDKFNIERFEKYMHVVMLKLKWVYLVLQADAESKNLSEDVKAFTFFMNNNLSSRHLYNDCIISILSDLYANYQMYLDYGAECISGVCLQRGDALALMQSEIYNKSGTKYYLDIPYAETNDATYVSKFFDQIEFAKRLSELKGTYLVSSRFNICVDTQKNKQAALQIKKRNVFKFYSSFVLKDEMKKYVEFLDKYIEISNEEESSEQKWFNVTGNEAKYVFFPFTKSSIDYGMKSENKQPENNSDDKEKRESKYIFKQNAKLTLQYIRRMLAGTQFSNIPVEVMITNADIDISAKSLREISEGVWVMPTFKTGIDAGTYKAEPVIVVMEYSKYLETLLHTLAPDAWEAFNSIHQASAAAKYFRKIFNL